MNNLRFKDINYCLRCGAILKIKTDHENKLRPQCSKCDWIYYKNPIPASACVVFDSEKRLLIIKRKGAPQAGKWALPSGYIEIDQSPANCAVQELLEETNLLSKVDTFIDYYWGESEIYEKVISFGFLMKVTGGKLQAGDDALEAKFVPISELPEIAFKSHEHLIKLALQINEKKQISVEE